MTMKLYEARQENLGHDTLRTFHAKDDDAALDRVRGLIHEGFFNKNQSVDVYEVTNEDSPALHIGSAMVLEKAKA
jgi:hypothetical protein